MSPGTTVSLSDTEHAAFFVFAEPLKGWRHVSVSERRAKKDCAEHVAELLDVHDPTAPKVCLVMDNLNTHAISSLYEAFPPDRARAYARRLEIHFTPKHGSWLNIAEIELSAMSSQCLDRRIPCIDLLRDELASWNTARNAASTSVDWRLSTLDARIKLKRIYPIV